MKKDAVIQDLKDFISIPSVSADSTRYDSILKGVDFLKDKLKELGCEVQIIDGDHKPPLVVGVKTVPHARHTLGIYGHYDVQHEDPVVEWDSNPYDLTIKKGKIYGRGVADNKGHIIQNIQAIKDLIEEKELHNNIVFLFEGEEEIGSERFEELVKKGDEIFKKVDVFFITDMGMKAKGIPQIFYSLRGLVYFQLEVTIGKKDLHSGVYGNAVYNPVQVIADMLAKMKDVHTGEVLIPGFYDNVRELDRKELDLLTTTKITDKNLAKEAEVKTVIKIKGYPAELTPKILPSLDVSGIIGGYTGPGPKTIIPRTARVKFSCRLVEYQNPVTIEKKVKEFVAENIPKGIDYTLDILSRDYPFYTSVDNEYIQKTAHIFSDHFEHPTLFNRSGGSVPAAEILQKIYKKPVVLTGFTLPDDNIHAPNENFDEEMFWEGLEALRKVYKEL